MNMEKIVLRFLFGKGPYGPGLYFCLGEFHRYKAQKRAKNAEEKKE